VVSHRLRKGSKSRLPRSFSTSFRRLTGSYSSASGATAYPRTGVANIDYLHRHPLHRSSRTLAGLPQEVATTTSPRSVPTTPRALPADRRATLEEEQTTVNGSSHPRIGGPDLTLTDPNLSSWNCDLAGTYQGNMYCNSDSTFTITQMKRGATCVRRVRASVLNNR
jgi:hypothetical protein